MGYSLHLGDCCEVMDGLPDASVDLILADFPYFRAVDEPWDRQWDTAAGFLVWMGTVLDRFVRVLRPNGSVYVFASPRMAARVEVTVAERFSVLNHIVWAKPSGWAEAAGKEGLRAFFPQSERIIFADHYGSDNLALGGSGYAGKLDELRGFVFEPLRAYLDGERQRAGFSKPDVDRAWCAYKRVPQTAQSQKWFSPSCWNLPTVEAYLWLRRLFNARGGDYLRREYEYLRREYEDLRREYEDLRRDYEYLRRPFFLTADEQYTDVWNFPVVQYYPGKHACEKPQALLQHIVAASSRPGAVVLDPFMGSGSTGLACHALGREFIGLDASPHWYEYASRRLENAERLHAGEFFAKRERAGELDDLPLFGGL